MAATGRHRGDPVPGTLWSGISALLGRLRKWRTRRIVRRAAAEARDSLWYDDLQRHHEHDTSPLVLAQIRAGVMTRLAAQAATAPLAGLEHLAPGQLGHTGQFAAVIDGVGSDRPAALR